MPEPQEEALPATHLQGTDAQMLRSLLHDTLAYFRRYANPETGLIADKTQSGAPASIAACGFALSCYIVGVEQDLMPRAEAVEHTLKMLRFFSGSEQSESPDATGYKGFYYHFLDMQTGKRVWNCELSTIDTALLMGGVCSAFQYYKGSTAHEQEIARLADGLYRRVEWPWALNGHTTFTHGWKPETGFLKWRWNKKLSEAHILYILAMGAPDHPIGSEGYHRWTDTFDWIEHYGIQYNYAGPLFIHQFAHLWLDLKGVRDGYNRKTGIDYFENSRRACYVHQQYAIENPNRFLHYNHLSWGLTASDGPGPGMRTVNGVRRYFYNYIARGAPFGPDDGTFSPWAVAASLPFAPEIVLPSMRHVIERLELKVPGKFGFDASFNGSFPDRSENRHGWVSPWRFGINEGPIILMIDNYQRGTMWKLMKGCPYIAEGMRKAGFEKFDDSI